jgi:nucleotide-binding universal stress UspA family protein
MRPFTNVLAYTPEGAGNAAVQAAARLTVATNAELTLTDVIEDMPAAARRYVPRGWDIPKLVRAEKQAHLERTAARVCRLGVEPEIVMLSGSPVKALVREVARSRHDLLAADASDSGRRESIGTTALGLVRECPCPVLLARPSHRRRRPRVLVAVNAAPLGMKGADMVNRTLLETALWLAECQGGELHVLHVWSPYGERAMLRGGLNPTEMHQFVAGMREQARHDLEPSLAPFREHISRGHIHFQKGDPRKAIARFAIAHRIDLLVIGTAGRKGLMARVIGNTAEAVLARIPCSMLVVRPTSVAGSRRG